MRFMKVALLLAATLAISACSRVEVAEEGIIVNKLGSDKGVEQEAKPTGLYWLTWNEYMVTFPLFTQTRVWTGDVRDDSPVNESFTITTSNGGQFQVDIGISYKVAKGESPIAFQKWRSTIDVITDKHIRRIVEDQFTIIGSEYTAFEIMSKRSEIVNKVESNLKKSLRPHGIVVENAFMIGIRPPEVIKNAMNAKMKSVEKTAQREQEVAQAEAEADILIAEATGKAAAIKLEGDALEANPLVLKARAIEKWNGELPKVTGQSDLMIDMGDMTGE